VSGISGFSGVSGFSGISGFSGKSGFSGTNASDIRLKRDIRPFVDGFNVLEKIRPVRYKWNGLWGHANNDKDVVGIIGQELESVAPYAITRIKDKIQPGGVATEVITVNPAAIIFLLVNAAKDLKAQIDALERAKP